MNHYLASGYVIYNRGTWIFDAVTVAHEKSLRNSPSSRLLLNDGFLAEMKTRNGDPQGRGLVEAAFITHFTKVSK